MAIAFARLEFVKRSSGKTACGKAAYNSRSRIHFDGNEFVRSQTYDWSRKPSPIYHEVFLPEHVDKAFLSPELLWNMVEKKETRCNSQVALDLVLALPDDKVISVEDRIYLAKSFVEENFTKKGVAAQVNIHAPEESSKFLEFKIEDENTDRNWHAHVLVTTRRFKPDGQEFEDHKARDLMPVIRGGMVISGENWGKLWAAHQNQFFEAKGLSLRVDHEGIIAQKHLGPVRMRGRAFVLLNENTTLIELNQLESEDPLKILTKITATKNIFSSTDVERFLHKHVDHEKFSEVREAFWNQGGIVQLLDPKDQKATGKFTTSQIIEEERQAIRIADRIHEKRGLKIQVERAFDAHAGSLNSEQQAAFRGILLGKRLSCLEGHAGTGKSHVLAALKNAYEAEGCKVRAFGPDSATSEVLKEKGFITSENVYRFLFAYQHQKRELKKGREIWFVDEVGKLGTRPLLELLKVADKHGAQLVLSGSGSQISSIERGGMFKVFSDRYGYHVLENIQRQKDLQQREIAKKLALGKMSEAIDAIVSRGSLKWANSKEDAIETLIKKWAIDRAVSPKDTTLIIAYSNAEVRALNEMARLYRKESGELAPKEYECETAFGRTYISVGDRVEFRKNDKELGVSNGSEGVLIEAAPEQFVVHMREGKNVRTVAFDPRKYKSFQLGYATTYYRSQGRTVDRAYVLHSPLLSREMFYVGLTRHVKNADFFLSSADCKCLSALKLQAYKQNIRESTHDFLTNDQIEQEQYQKAKREQIQQLKSGSLLQKIKGIGLSGAQELRTKAETLITKFKDRSPDEKFFNPELSRDNTLAKVQEVAPDSAPLQQHFREVLRYQKPPPKTKQQETWSTWDKLNASHQSLMREYYSSVDRTSALYTIVQAQIEDLKLSPHFSEWQQSCVRRNHLAHTSLHTIDRKQIKGLFDKKGYEILQERAARYEAHLQREQNPQIDLDERLKENLESLLYRLFPEGPSKRDSKGLRFGAKGSLAVSCAGEKIGTYYDFEQQEGGGPLRLIQRSLHLNSSEAKDWALGFLGESRGPIPSQFSTQAFSKAKENQWESLKPTFLAPSLKTVSPKLAEQYDEAMRHTYHDSNGEVLFHSLRLVDKQDPKKKIVLPLSYGYWKGGDNAPQWSLKGYQAERRPLYNLHLLQAYPKSAVLIVEGEKTADAASHMFAKEKIICLTWSGGASAASKTDWRPLCGREVVIWPDNDAAGFRAGDEICSELRRVGIRKLQIVDRELLKQFPEKWDLADPLPKEARRGVVQDLMLRAQEKSVGIERLMQELRTKGCDIGGEMANEVLWRVEEQLRPGLEQKLGAKSWEINREILEEVVGLIQDGERLKSIDEVRRSLGNRDLHASMLMFEGNKVEKKERTFSNEI